MSNEATSRLLSLTKPISPPPQSGRAPSLPLPSLSALEAGEQTVTDGSHLQTISAHLRNHIYAPSPRINTPDNTQSLLPIDAWESLYTRNAHKSGHHFVIHQHDHPIAGPHYDLRLQFSETSSLSWSCMYGMPGDANSRRLNRNATETRVHCLWNHLIETGSPPTGSIIIWDTGEYEVLPDKPKSSNGSAVPQDTDPDTATDESDTASDITRSEITESEKLRRAFQNGKIHLRLHGTRLPKNYTIFLHRDKSDHRSAPTPTSLLQKPIKKKRRRTMAKAAPSSTESSESEAEMERSPGSRKRKSRTPAGTDPDHGHEHSDAEPDVNSTEDTDFLIRLNNAYPGSRNDIGSVHQRRWFIVLDRVGSGFIIANYAESTDTETAKATGKGRKRWVRGVDRRTGALTGFEPFYVRGPDVERSVVTGRLGADVLKDEGIKGFIPRRGWRPVLL
ncbi:DNA polymerase ligase-domain-containing protein [Aspergillus oleicola]